jgi:hypothetical protein
MLRDIRVYAQVGRADQGFALWPKWPITIEGTMFDREHPILLGARLHNKGGARPGGA